MSDQDVLTREVAEKVADGTMEVTALRRFTSISDDAAAILKRFFKGSFLPLDGLTTLSKESATRLGEWTGNLWLNELQSISADVCRGLALNTRELMLGDVRAMSEEAGEALGAHAGTRLDLGLTSISAALGKSLSKLRDKWLSLSRLERVDAAAASALAGFEGTLYVPLLRQFDERAAAALGEKRFGRLIVNDRSVRVWSSNGLETLEPPPLVLTPEISAGLCRSPAFNPQEHEGAESMASDLLAPLVLTARDRKSVKADVSAAAKATDSLDEAGERAESLKSAFDKIHSLGGSEGDLNDVFSSATINKLVKTMNPRVWRLLAGGLNECPMLFARLCRVARDCVQSVKRSDGRLRACIDVIVAEEEPASAFLIAFILDQGVPYPICSEWEQLGAHGLSAVMAEAIARHQGTIVLSCDEMSAPIAKALSNSSQLLKLPRLRNLSDDAAVQLSKHRGWVEVDLSKLSSSAAELLRRSAVRFAIRSGLPCQRCGGDATSCKC
jgi:hypothetical protein